MAVPVVTISNNVIAYHESLPYTTKLEQEAYATAKTLRVVWPLAVLLTPVLQVFLLWAYNKYGHPWKDILAKMGEVVEAQQKIKVSGEEVQEKMDLQEEEKHGDDKEEDEGSCLTLVNYFSSCKERLICSRCSSE